MRKKSVILCRVFSLLFIISSQLIGQQPPRITSFWPLNGVIGAEVTIAGTNFSPNPSDNIVRFGGIKADVITASSTMLTVKVPPGAQYEPINVFVSGKTAFSSNSFMPGFSGGGAINADIFQLSSSFNKPFYQDIRFGDVDDDGNLDVLMFSAGGIGNTISVYRNISTTDSIAFATPLILTSAGFVFDIRLADINGDGKLDIVAANRNINSISVFQNKSVSGVINASSFSPPVTVTAIYNADRLDCRDVDGDGKTDIAVFHSPAGGTFIRLFQNFSTPDSIVLLEKFLYNKLAMFPGNIQFADLNNDQRPDFVYVSYYKAKIAMLRNTNNSDTINQNSFAEETQLVNVYTPPKTSGRQYPTTFTITDLNADGKPEIISSGFYGSTAFTIYKNITANPPVDSVPIFGPPMHFELPYSTGLIIVRDFNGDGKGDLLAIGHLFEGNGKSDEILFNQKIYLPMGGGNTFTEDLNGDGKSDIIKGTSNDSGYTYTFYKNINAVALGVESESNGVIPISYELHQNYPNPFNPTTTIRYALAEKSRVKLEIFNVLGQKISTLVDAEQEARYYDVAWNPTISSGIYFYRIQAQSINNSSKTFVQVRSMMLVK